MMSSKLEIPTYGHKHSAVLCKFSGFHSGATEIGSTSDATFQFFSGSWTI